MYLFYQVVNFCPEIGSKLENVTEGAELCIDTGAGREAIGYRETPRSQRSEIRGQNTT